MRQIVFNVKAYWIFGGTLALCCGQVCGQPLELPPQICPTIVPGAAGAPATRMATPLIQKPLLTTARGPTVMGPGMSPGQASRTLYNRHQANTPSDLQPPVGRGEASDADYPGQPSDFADDPVALPLSTALPMGLNGQPAFSMSPPTTSTGIARASAFGGGPRRFTVTARWAPPPPRRNSFIRRGGCR